MNKKYYTKSYKKILELISNFILFFIIISMISLGYSATNFKMEWGTTTTINEDWTQVNLVNSYISPVVVVTPQYNFNPTSGIDSWVTNVTYNSFLTRSSNELLTNANSLSVHYIVMEQGDWILPGTTIKVEAGSLSTNKVGYSPSAWTCPTYGETTTFTNPFNSNPLVITSRGSNNNPSSWTSTFQTSPISIGSPIPNNQMCIGLSNSNAAATTSITLAEDIYWIAADSGFGTLGSTEFEILFDSVGWVSGATTNIAYTKNWLRTWTGSPNIILGSITSIAGTDGAWPAIFDVGNTVSLRMFSEEADGGAHAAESGGGWAFDTSGAIRNIAPNNINVSTNLTQVIKSYPIGINAIVTDINGNNTISNVTVTILDSNNSYYNLSLNPELINLSTNSEDLELGLTRYEATIDTGIIGETGELSLENRTQQTITFTQTYNQTPIIIAIAASENNDINPFIPIIHSINTTHAEISLCRDIGATTCDNNYTSETVNYAIFDKDKANLLSWIDVGTVSASTGGNSTSFTFGKTFSNTPSVFSLSQSYNIGGNNIAAHSWVDPISTTGASMIGCDHPGTVDTCGGTFTESFGYVAIDFTNVNLDSFSGGVSGISNSDWTGISFGRTYTNANVFVLVNTDSGPQDGKYPQAKLVTTTGASIRYCEADGQDACDSHTTEFTAWFALETGVIRVSGTTSTVEDSGTPILYDTNLVNSTHIINNINFNVGISIYNSSGSVSNGNLLPDLELEFLTANSNWNSLGSLSIGSVGNYNLLSTDLTLISDWVMAENRQLRVVPINFDSASAILFDKIEWDSIFVEINYSKYTSKWQASFTDTTSCDTNNITSMTSVDNMGFINMSNYTNKSFEVLCVPEIILVSPLDQSKIKSNNLVEFIFNVTFSAASVSCDLLIGGIVQQTSSCLNGTNSFYYSSGVEYNNWSINASDSNNFSTLSNTYNFFNIFNQHKLQTKSISRINSNQYKITNNINNLVNYTSDIKSIEFVETKLIAGSFSMIADFTNLTFGNYIGINYGWDFLLAPNSNVTYSYSITSIGFRRIEDTFILGLE